MPANDFLVFGGGGSANVMSQSDWAALAQRLTGFQAGVAQSAQLNKAWRQSSIMAAVLAQFIANNSGQNAVDDGTTATLLANLLIAVRSSVKQQVILADTGAANAYTAANAPALAALPANGFIQYLSIANANSGASTYAPDGLAAKPIYGLNLTALQGGELVVNGVAALMYVVASTVNSGNGAWILLDCTGGALQVAPGTASGHAVQTGKPYFQASAANSATTADAVPSGSGVGGGYRAWGAANQLNCAYGQVTLLSTEYRIDSGAVGSGTVLPMTFMTNAIERARFDTSGNLLIGKTATAFGTAGIIMSTTGSLTLTANHGATCLPFNVISASGTENAASFSYNSSVVGSISMTASATAFNTSSDYRLKENVAPLTGALARLARLPVHRFNFKVDPGHTVDGFLAHEAQAVVPEAVTGTKDATREAMNVVLDGAGRIIAEGIAEASFDTDREHFPEGSAWAASIEVPVMQAIDQSKLVPLLVAALQELNEKFEAYKTAHP